MMPNVTSFLVPLTYDLSSNTTALWDRASKQPFMANEYRYQSIMQILNNKRDLMMRCNYLIEKNNEQKQVFYFDFVFKMIAHCFLRYLK